jgi:pseudouridine synthase
MSASRRRRKQNLIRIRRGVASPASGTGPSTRPGPRPSTRPGPRPSRALGPSAGATSDLRAAADTDPTESPAGSHAAPAPQAPGERLQRVLADAGIASRRACEELIRRGHVSVNGRVVTDLPAFADPVRDRIEVDGRPLKRPRAVRPPHLAGLPTRGRDTSANSRPHDDANLVGTRHVYVMLFKPARVLTSLADTPQPGMEIDPGELEAAGRTTIADLVQHPSAPRLYPVGRLGFHASGLVLLTNDGDLAHRLSHASFGVTKTYRVWARGLMTPQQANELQETLGRVIRSAAYRKGIASRRFGPSANSPAGSAFAPRANAPAASTPPTGAPSAVKVELVQTTGSSSNVGQERDDAPGRTGGFKTVVDITLPGAKDAKLDMFLAQAGFKPARIMQVGLGPLRLSGVAFGQWRELRTNEVRQLRRATGLEERP